MAQLLDGWSLALVCVFFFSFLRCFKNYGVFQHLSTRKEQGLGVECVWHTWTGKHRFPEYGNAINANAKLQSTELVMVLLAG